MREGKAAGQSRPKGRCKESFLAHICYILMLLQESAVNSTIKKNVMIKRFSFKGFRAFIFFSGTVSTRVPTIKKIGSAKRWHFFFTKFFLRVAEGKEENFF